MIPVGRARCVDNDLRLDVINAVNIANPRIAMASVVNNDELKDDNVIADLRAQDDTILRSLDEARAQNNVLINGRIVPVPSELDPANGDFLRVLAERDSLIAELRGQNDNLNQLVGQLRCEIGQLNERMASMDMSLLSIASNLSTTSCPPPVSTKRRSIKTAVAKSSSKKAKNASTPVAPADDTVTITDVIGDSDSEVDMGADATYEYQFPAIVPNANVPRPFLFGTPIPIATVKRPESSHSATSVPPRIASAATTSVTDLSRASSASDSSQFCLNGWSTVTAKPKKTKNKSALPATDNADGQRVTPIQLQKMNASELIGLSAELAKLVDSNEMFIQQMGDNTMPRIVCKSAATKEIIVDYLRGNQLQFNSYNNAISRRKAFIVRGLICDDVDEAIALVRSAVSGMGIVEEVGVRKFETAYQRHHPSTGRVPLYQLTVPSSVNDQTLLDIYTIGYSRVRIEKMKKSSTIQCHRCQRLHHTTGQCNFDYRCVQCTSSHVYGNCPRATNHNLPIGCINCHEAKLNSRDHTANDLRNCNYFKKIVEQQQQRKNQQQQRAAPAGRGPMVSARPLTANNSVSNAGLSGYANAVKGGAGGLSAAQIADLVTMTVKSVIAALNNGC